ncbi:MAG: bifunctional phosphoribosyl-AMP cyclohydrolase/phosphoribosyl-ATP diphosphatase HisIE [Hyphomonadaceae bacterium]|nr:bifunctional phosphoribosyl-AMP cyclohydrolase/phosphoribosyl-ATP diphosphatase HisIE [Clostridia bacterium]
MIKFDEKGLIPAIVQDADTGAVLMMAYMNEQAFQKTVETGKATFYSRSRNALWTKGETSGNFLNVVNIAIDCDMDTILIQANPEGPACHTENATCFYRQYKDGSWTDTGSMTGTKSSILQRVYDVIKDRQENPVEGSYTNYLFNKGIDKTLKKVGEEAAEVIIAAKNPDKSELSYEVADLLYHLSVMLVQRELTLEDIYEELNKRYK